MSASMCDCDGTEDVVDSTIETALEKPEDLAVHSVNCEVEGCAQTFPGACNTADSNDASSSSSSTSKCSADSTRIYKYVNLWELECKRNSGGEGGESDGECDCHDELLDESEDEVPDVELTLAIVKPEAVADRIAIERRMIEARFAIQISRMLQMSSEQVSEFYADGYDKPDFAHLVAYMASGPVVVYLLAKKQAIEDWRTLMGPTKVADARLYFPDSIRARYGRRGHHYQNAVHGSDSREQAEREIHFFFPDVIIEPLPKGKKAEDYLWEAVNKVLVKGLALCCKEKPKDPILWLADWLLVNNPNTTAKKISRKKDGTK